MDEKRTSKLNFQNETIQTTIVDEFALPSEKQLNYDVKMKNPKIASRCRQTNKCYNLLLELDEFRKYTLTNHVPISTVEKAIDLFDLEYFSRHSYVFKQGEPSNKFYILLNGTISVRERKRQQIEEKIIKNNVERLNAKGKRPSFRNMTKRVADSYGSALKGSKFGVFKFSLLKKNNNLAEIEANNEVEKFVLSTGMCFGDWGILSGATRSASCWCNDDTYLLSLNKEKFLNTFGKYVNKTYADKINFLMNTLNGFSSLGRSRFDAYYRRMKFNYYKMNEVVFSRGNSDNCIYIIYEGRFELRSVNRGRERKLIEIERGDVGGFELIIGASKYEFTLVVFK